MKRVKAIFLTMALIATCPLLAMEKSSNVNEQQEQFGELLDRLNVLAEQDSVDDYIKIAKEISVHPYVTTFSRTWGRAKASPINYALILASTFDQENMLKKLLEKKADPNIENGVALNSVLEHGYIKAAKLLVDAGAVITEDHLLTAIARAQKKYSGEYSSLQFIVEQNPELFLQNYEALLRCHGWIEQSVKQALIEKGEELKKAKKTVTH